MAMVRVGQAVFWGAALITFYANIGYTLLLGIIVRLLHWRRDTTVEQCSSQQLPTVTLIISAHNEESVIDQKIQNSLSIEYPADLLEIIVISDGSDDNTDNIVLGYADRNVRLVRTHHRVGKVDALHQAVEASHGDVLALSDANSMYERNALLEMIAALQDESVGAVTGREVRNQAGDKIGGEDIYCKIDNITKTFEGLLGTMVMVNGGIFCIRRELYPFIPGYLTHDSSVPQILAMQNYRTAYAPGAVSHEDYTLSQSEDFTRRIRTVNHAFASHFSVSSALNPMRTGLFALQVLSHRIIRWFTLPMLLLMLTSNAYLRKHSPFYRFSFVIQVSFYGSVILGFFLDRLGYPTSLICMPYHALSMYTAAFIGVIRAISGRRVSVWTPTRRDSIGP